MLRNFELRTENDEDVVPITYYPMVVGQTMPVFSTLEAIFNLEMGYRDDVYFTGQC